MLGRALFVLVCLVIAAGVALPLCPSEMARPAIAAADGGLLLADASAAGCAQCTHTANRGAACRVTRHTLPTVSTPPGACLSLTVYLVVRPALPGTRTSDLGLLRLRLSTI
jgi:hypothetical protein